MANLKFTMPFRVDGITVATITGVADIRPDEEDHPTLRSVMLDGVDADGKAAQRVLTFNDQLHRLVHRNLWTRQYEGPSFAEAVQNNEGDRR